MTRSNGFWMPRRHPKADASVAWRALGALLVAAMVGTSALAAGEPPGSVITWGPYGTGLVTGLSDVVQVAPLKGISPYNSGWALKRDGTVTSWGLDSEYRPLPVPTGLSDVIAISAGEAHATALKRDGTVVGWGYEGWGTPPTGLTDVTAIASGRYHTLALKRNGTVVAWAPAGTPDYGQSTVPAGLANVTAIGVGMYHSLAVKSDGTVVAWGFTGFGGSRDPTAVPAGLTQVVAVTGGYTQSLALKQDGTVVAWGDWYSPSVNVPPGLSGVTQIAAYFQNSFALKADGTVVGWGSNLDGYGNATPADPPMGLVSGATAIGAAISFGAAVIGQQAQTIAFNPLTDKLFGAAPFKLSASASSGLPVTFSSLTVGVCSMTGDQVQILAAGACTVRASQAGDSQWLPAQPVDRSFIVGYGVSAVEATRAINSGSTFPVKFVLTGANGAIPPATAASLGCTVTVAFRGDAPQCATYLAAANRFQAEIKTARTVPPGVYPVVIRVVVGPVTVASASLTLSVNR